MLQFSTQNNSWITNSQLPLLWPLLVFLESMIARFYQPFYFSQTAVAAICIFGVSMIATCLQGKHWLYHKFGLTFNKLKIRVDWRQKRKQDVRICTLNLTKKARAKGEILRTHAHMRGEKERRLPASLLLLSPVMFPWCTLSLQKQPLLLALRRWGRFARRNICDSATEIPYRWRKSMFT